MRTYSKKAFWFVTTMFLAVAQTPVFAANSVSNSSVLIPNPLGPNNNTIAAFIVVLLDTIFPIAAMVAVFFLIYSGFRMVIFASQEEKLSEAKRAFLWTVIGIAILLGAKVLSAVICGTVNQLSTTHLSCPTP